MVILYLQKQKFLFCLLLSFFLIGFISYLCWHYNYNNVQSGLNKLTILIDPGHGGVDGGTSDQYGNLEKDVNLAIGLKLNEQLRQSGINALITRETDTDLSPFISGKKGRHRRDLMARLDKAMKSKSFFLVSIHCDWWEEPERSGIFTFYNYKNPLSKELAFLVQEELNKLQSKPKKPAPGNYFLIKQQGIAGIIIEVGFLSNPSEAKLLSTQEYQEKMALAITKGILNYFKSHTPVDY